MGVSTPIQYTNTTTYDDVKAAMGFDGRLKYHNRKNPMTIPDFQKIKKPFQKYPIDFEIYSDKRIDRLNATYLDNEKQFEFKNTFFYDLDIKEKHFFNVDDHLNVKGHKHVAKKLADIINTK